MSFGEYGAVRTSGDRTPSLSEYNAGAGSFFLTTSASRASSVLAVPVSCGTLLTDVGAVMSATGGDFRVAATKFGTIPVFARRLNVPATAAFFESWALTCAVDGQLDERCVDARVRSYEKEEVPGFEIS